MKVHVYDDGTICDAENFTVWYIDEHHQLYAGLDDTADLDHYVKVGVAQPVLIMRNGVIEWSYGSDRSDVVGSGTDDSAVQRVIDPEPQEDQGGSIEESL